MNREEWLTRAVEKLTPLFTEKGHTVPPVRVSVGWPSTKPRRVRGECWNTSAAEDGISQIFISPMRSRPISVLTTLAHELIHAIDNCEHGHRGAFIKIGRSIGLIKPWTTATAGPELLEKIAQLANELGPYPHSALRLSDSQSKPQGTRMLKVTCEDCTDPEGNPVTVRTTRKWLDLFGAPFCPNCKDRMEEAV